MQKFNQVKRWAWWRIHEIFLVGLASSAIKTLMSKVPEVEAVSFTLKGKIYSFTREVTREYQS